MRVGFSQHAGSSVSALAGAVGLALLFAWEYGMAHLPRACGSVPFGSLFYLVSAVGLLAATLFTRNRIPAPRAVAALDVLSGVGMAVAGGALGIGTLPFGVALAVVVLAGFGATWMFVRWGTGVAHLGVRESIISVCCSMILAAFCKALMAALPEVPVALFLVGTAVAATVCLGLFERGARGGAFEEPGASEADGPCASRVRGRAEDVASDAPTPSASSGADRSRDGLFSGRTFARFMILCFGIAAFSFTTSMAQAVFPGGFYMSSGPVAFLDALLEGLLALGLVGWVVALRRRLSFTWSWRALLILTGVALALIPYASFGVGGLGELQRLADDASIGGFVGLFAQVGGFEGISLGLVRTVQSLIVGLWFLALADVVRYNRSSQFAAFAIGWCAYALPSALGGLFGVLMLSFGATAVILLSIAAPVLIAVAFLVDEVSLGGRRLFQPSSANSADEGFIHAEFGTRTAAGFQPEGERPVEVGSAAAQPVGASGVASLCPAAAQGMCASCEVCAVTGGPAPADGLALAATPADLPAMQAGGGAIPVVVADPLAAKCDRAAACYGLTGREREVLELLLRGRSKAYIAEALVISENTVRGHVKRLYTKMDVHDRQELINKLEE